MQGVSALHVPAGNARPSNCTDFFAGFSPSLCWYGELESSFKRTGIASSCPRTWRGWKSIKRSMSVKLIQLVNFFQTVMMPGMPCYRKEYSKKQLHLRYSTQLVRWAPPELYLIDTLLLLPNLQLWSLGLPKMPFHYGVRRALHGVLSIMPPLLIELPLLRPYPFRDISTGEAQQNKVRYKPLHLRTKMGLAPFDPKKARWPHVFAADSQLLQTQSYGRSASSCSQDAEGTVPPHSAIHPRPRSDRTTNHHGLTRLGQHQRQLELSNPMER